MTDVVLSEKAAHRIDNLVASWPQAVLFTGEPGLGINYIARSILPKQQIISHIVPQPSSSTSTMKQIGVERIRELYKETRNTYKTAAFVLIESADTMSISAQNAILKLLEEPQPNVHFVLTSHDSHKLLPTIQSRVHTTVFPKVSTEQSIELIDTLGIKDDLVKKQLLFIADGLPAEITRLAQDSDYFRTVHDRIIRAKNLIEADSYGKLQLLFTMPKDRGEVLQTIYAMCRLLTVSPKRKGMKTLSLLQQAARDIEQGGNVKLQLLRSVL